MVWLYVPGLACSTKDCDPHASFLDANTAPFATWSGKPLLPRSLSRSWKTARLIRRLSGLTFSPSTAQRGADAWIASLPASHAKTLASPAAELGSTEIGPGFSSTSSTLPTIALRSASFWRTSQASLLQPPPLWTRKKVNSKSVRPPASWENWPTAGGMRNGSLFPRPALELGTDGCDGSAMPGEWLTPNVPNGGRSVSAELVATKGTTADGVKRTVGLESQSKHWPTPDASVMERTNRSLSEGAAVRPTLALSSRQWATPDCNTSSYSNGKMGPNIREQAVAWPSPRASDAAKGGPNQRGSQGDLMLPSMAAQWPTPATRDFRTPNSQESQESRNHSGGEQLPNFVEHHFSRPVLSTIDGRELSPTVQTLPQRLNPAFACWLMGWPTWWTNPAVTNCVRSEMELYRSRLQQHLCSLFDELASHKEST